MGRTVACSKARCHCHVFSRARVVAAAGADGGCTWVRWWPPLRCWAGWSPPPRGYGRGGGMQHCLFGITSSSMYRVWPRRHAPRMAPCSDPARVWNVWDRCSTRAAAAGLKASRSWGAARGKWSQSQRRAPPSAGVAGSAAIALRRHYTKGSYKKRDCR